MFSNNDCCLVCPDMMSKIYLLEPINTIDSVKQLVINIFSRKTVMVCLLLHVHFIISRDKTTGIWIDKKRLYKLKH